MCCEEYPKRESSSGPQYDTNTSSTCPQDTRREDCRGAQVGVVERFQRVPPRVVALREELAPRRGRVDRAGARRP